MSILLILISVFGILYSFPNLVKKPSLDYILKPLTTVLIIVLAFTQQPEVFTTYKYLVIGALILSLAGDVFLMLPTDKFVHGLASFLGAHILYIIAFGQGFGPYTEISYLIPSAVYSIVFLWILLPKTGKMKVPVLVYALVLMVFLWQATGRFYYLADESSLYIFLGAILFVVSDTILAYSRFVKNFKVSRSLIHLTYWGAQIFLALSI